MSQNNPEDLEATSWRKTPTQHDRWLKYGTNVAITTVVAIALAALVTYAAERKPKRIDTTMMGLYSLKPQTINIIRGVTDKIHIVNLYTKEKPREDENGDAPPPTVVPPETAQLTVSDLLNEYASYNKNISVENIDPIDNPGKTESLINDIEQKYGGEVAKYEKFVKAFKGTIEQIKAIAQPETDAVQKLTIPNNLDDEVFRSLEGAIITVEGFPKLLTNVQDSLQKPLNQKPPDYKGAADAITSGLGTMSNYLDPVVTQFAAMKDRANVPADVKQYMSSSLPHYQALKKLLDDSQTEAKNLGELKLDTLRSALREKNTILVMGDKEWRVIGYDQVWPNITKNEIAALSHGPPKPHFAGEQQVTAAIMALSSGHRTKLVFVRNGGQPLIHDANGGDGPLADLATRLALYNFEILEKDASGMYGRGGGEQGPPAPEATDQDLKEGTWIVLDFPASQQSEMGPPPSISDAVAAHLKEGGSALILAGYQQDALTNALSDWGITLKSDMIVVHEQIARAEDGSDPLQNALRQPVYFLLHDFGDHPLANPIRSLDGLFAGLAPVTLQTKAGYTGKYLLPIPTAPQAPRSWATPSMTQIDPNVPIKFNAKTDIDGQLYSGAAVEKTGGGRLVLLAGGPFFGFMNAASDNALLFPADGELYSNAVFWAAHQDPLIDISPAAMDVGRIRDISDNAQRFWKFGVLMTGLPLLIIALGAGVYVSRRG